ncbi:MAG TPA: ABC transporter substrate-binding protein [Acidimicrobiia bacterium]|nr:ABC transporter substrate-binding protein [Acidimicrobiia bacterium]
MKRSMIGLLSMSLILSACLGDDAGSNDDLSDSCEIEDLALVTPGTLTVATGEPAFPPYVLDDDPSSKQGFESAVAYAVANEMGFTDDQVTWVRAGFNESIAVGPKTFDFNIQQYSITEEREQVVDFSDPYYETNQALVGYSDSALVGVTTLDELRQYRLGAQIGTTSLAYIEKVIQPDQPAAVFDDHVAAKVALDAGQIDAVVFDLPTAYYITAVEMEGSEIIGVLEADDESADFFGLLMQNDSPLRDCVNAAIGRLREAGTLEALAEQWMQGAGDIPTIRS